MSKFIEHIRNEDEGAMSRARHASIRSDAIVRKRKFILNDKEILHIINTYDRLDSNKDLFIFLKTYSYSSTKFL